MRAGTLIAALTLTVNSGAVYNAAAQAPTVITDRVQCRECRIKHSLVATLGRSNDADLLADAPVIAHSGGPLFLAVGSIPRVKVLVYDSTGRQVTAWGRQGSGPGEFRGIRSVRRFRGDSVLVLEPGPRRATVLAPTGSYVRQVQLPLAADEIVPLAHAWVVAGIDFERGGHPLHTLSTSGELLASFGGPLAPPARGRLSSVTRIIAADHSGAGVWAARPDRYELEHWSVAGQRTMVVHRRAGWFPPVDRVSRSKWSDPIFPGILSLYQDSQGLLWVLGRVPKDRWRPTPENYGLTLQTDPLNYDTVIEVLDVKARRLLASPRYPWVAHRFTESGLVVSHRENADGILVAALWRVSLTR
jgi:hypothetical protein